METRENDQFRLEIWNPGQLPFGLTIEMLKTEHPTNMKPKIRILRFAFCEKYVFLHFQIHFYIAR
jgi:predicted HTH transcriptional regulator